MKYQRTKNRVLLVSDDFTVRESLGDMLRSDGFEVLSAENGLKAVKALAANPINVIVLDFRTPFDGKDFVSGRSSTLEALTDIDPFLPLVLTRESEVELDHATSLMADLVLTHPVVPSALLESIDMLLVETLKERVHRKSGDLAIYR
jgi:two-component system alkaline phosphatase synthesis response regulator PhoP